MQESIRPVAIGFILGVLCLIFGIFWAIYLVVGHESIHKTLRDSARAAVESKFVVSPSSSEEMHDHSHMAEGSGMMVGTAHPTHDTPKVAVKKEGKAVHIHGMGEHADPLENEAHERLRRGHIHEMGLGILTIAVSFVLAFLTAPDRVKTFASACIGFGSFVYPFAWIVMGYRTTAMGLDASAQSILPIVAVSVPLVLLGLFITMFYLIKGFLTRVRP